MWETRIIVKNQADAFAIHDILIKKVMGDKYIDAYYIERPSTNYMLAESLVPISDVHLTTMRLLHKGPVEILVDE